MASCSRYGSFAVDPPVLEGNTVAATELMDAGISNHLFQMDAELFCMDAIIDDLLRKRAAKSRIRNQFARISSLPNELLVEIFVATLEPPPSGALGTDCAPDSTNVPLVLGQVCTEWRNIAREISALWTAVHCHVSQNKCVKQAEILSEWLTRSNDRPLTIRISFTDENAWTGSKNSTAIIDALIPHCHKWHNVSLILPESWHNKLSSIVGKLERLEFVSIRPPGLLFVQKPVTMFLGAPALREVHISHYYLHDLSFSWNQITTVTIVNASADEAVELLKRCPNLISCRLVDLNPSEEQFVVGQVYHHTLRMLSISLDPSAHLDPALDLLTLPSLRGLFLSLPKAHDSPVRFVEGLVNRSSCPLKVVKVMGPTITDQDIFDLLLNIKSLLRVTNNNKHDNIAIDDVIYD